MPFDPSEFYTPILREARAHLHLDPAGVTWRDGLLLRTTNWLGDALMTLPATWCLSRHVPEGASTMVLCPENLVPLWRAAPWIDTIVPLAGKRCRGPCRTRLRTLHAGVAVVMPNSFGSALDVFGVGIPLRLGRGGRGRSPLLTHRLPSWHRGPGMAPHHQLSHYLDLAAVFGPVATARTGPPLRVEEGHASALGMRADDGPWLVVAPGAAYGPAKQWPLENFLAVSRWWHRTRGPVAIVGTKKEQFAQDVIRRDIPEALPLAGKTNLEQLMAVLRQATVLVTNDSGAMHLGGALGCRGVAIFGSTDPVATGPIGGQWILLHDPPACAPCFQRSCPHPDKPYQCLQNIEPDRVVDALNALVEPPNPQAD